MWYLCWLNLHSVVTRSRKCSSRASCINTWDYISGQRLLSARKKYSLTHPSQGRLESYVFRQRQYSFGSLQAAVSCFGRGQRSVRMTPLRLAHFKIGSSTRVRKRVIETTSHWLQGPPFSFNGLIQQGHSGFACQREQRSVWPQGQRWGTVQFRLQAWTRRWMPGLWGQWEKS